MPGDRVFDKETGASYRYKENEGKPSVKPTEKDKGGQRGHASKEHERAKEG
jgi:hypothetical protein